MSDMPENRSPLPVIERLRPHLKSKRALLVLPFDDAALVAAYASVADEMMCDIIQACWNASQTGTVISPDGLLAYIFENREPFLRAKTHEQN